MESKKSEEKSQIGQHLELLSGGGNVPKKFLRESRIKFINENPTLSREELAKKFNMARFALTDFMGKHKSKITYQNFDSAKKRDLIKPESKNKGDRKFSQQAQYRIDLINNNNHLSKPLLAKKLKMGYTNFKHFIAKHKDYLNVNPLLLRFNGLSPTSQERLRFIVKNPDMSPKLLGVQFNTPSSSIRDFKIRHASLINNFSEIDKGLKNDLQNYEVKPQGFNPFDAPRREYVGVIDLSKVPNVEFNTERVNYRPAIEKRGFRSLSRKNQLRITFINENPDLISEQIATGFKLSKSAVSYFFNAHKKHIELNLKARRSAYCRANPAHRDKVDPSPDSERTDYQIIRKSNLEKIIKSSEEQESVSKLLKTFNKMKKGDGLLLTNKKLIRKSVIYFTDFSKAHNIDLEVIFVNEKTYVVKK